jgi:hypothetical protein
MQKTMTQVPNIPALAARKGLPQLLVWLVLVAILSFQLYPTFDSYFVSDDFGILRFFRSHEHLLDAVLQPGLGDWTTPVSNLIFWVLFQVFAYEPLGYIVVIALIHVFNAWLVYKLLSVAAARETVALGAAFVFALHFIHFSDWGPLVWISAFVHVVTASFYLATLILFISYTRRGRRSHYLGSLICFALALGAKETAASLPFLLSAWCILGLLPIKRRWRDIGILLVPFFIVFGLYLLYKVFFQESSNRYLEAGLYGFGSHLISNWKYFSNLIIPNPESPPVHSFLVQTFPTWVISVADLALLLGRVVLMILAALVWLRGSKRVRLWLVLAIVSYLPFVAFLGGHAGANRYFYLPAVGFSALVAEGFMRFFDGFSKRRGVAPATAAVLFILVSFWAASLIPVRNWQGRMTSTSQVSREVIAALAEPLTDRASGASPDVYLQGFSQEEFQRLQQMVLLVYGIEAQRISFDEKPILPSDESITLLYQNGHVIRDTTP